MVPERGLDPYTGKSEAALAQGDKPALSDPQIAQGSLVWAAAPTPRPFLGSNIRRRHQTSARAVGAFWGKQFRVDYCCQHELGWIAGVCGPTPDRSWSHYDP